MQKEQASSTGLGGLLLGVILAAAGGYLVANQVMVSPNAGVGWARWAPATSGLALVPILVGIGLLCFNAGSRAGRLLTIGGAVLLVASIIASLSLSFRPTSLFDTLVMLVLCTAGAGLMARSVLRPDGQSRRVAPPDEETVLHPQNTPLPSARAPREALGLPPASAQTPGDVLTAQLEELKAVHAKGSPHGG